MKRSTSRVYNLIILDASGSMESIKDYTINGFNEIIQQIGNIAESDFDLEQWLNFYSFNSNGIKEHIPLCRVESVSLLNESNYIPDALTPLYDAIGFITVQLERQIQVAEGYAVLVTILTDGCENASVEYTKDIIAERINNLSKKGWLFTYMGANHDVKKAAQDMYIENYIEFKGDNDGLDSAIDVDLACRFLFYSKLSSEYKFPSEYKYFESE